MYVFYVCDKIATYTTKKALLLTILSHYHYSISSDNCIFLISTIRQTKLCPLIKYSHLFLSWLYVAIRHKKRANLLQFTLSFQERLIMTYWKPSHLSIVIITNLHWLSKQFYLFCLFQPIVNSSVFIINRFPYNLTLFTFCREILFKCIKFILKMQCKRTSFASCPIKIIGLHPIS